MTAIFAAGQSQSDAPQMGRILRTTKAINYHLRGDSITVGMHGTDLMSNATGEAKV